MEQEKKMTDQFKYDRYQVILAIFSVLASFYVIYQQFIQTEKLNNVQVAIEDNQDLRNSLTKPLEGVWSYKTHYTKFHGEEGDWESSGKAIFTWRPNDLRYEVFFASTIIKRGETDNRLVTLFANGLLPSDYFGMPEDNFSIDVEYLGRTGVEPYRNASYETFSYDDCRMEKDQNGRVNKILTTFNSKKSYGEVTFTFQKK